MTSRDLVEAAEQQTPPNTNFGLQGRSTILSQINIVSQINIIVNNILSQINIIVFNIVSQINIIVNIILSQINMIKFCLRGTFWCFQMWRKNTVERIIASPQMW